MNTQNTTLEDKVLEFRIKLGLPVSEVPVMLTYQRMSFYSRFLNEEMSELLLAREHENIVDMADAIGDLIYVLHGLAHEMGLPMDKILSAIHEANMRKEPGISKRAGGNDAFKPADWVGPEKEIASILYRETKHVYK